MIFEMIHGLPLTDLLAMAPPPPQPGENPLRGVLLSMGPIVIIFVLFYIVLLRPQQKQQNELQKMLNALKAGDRVITTGGIFGVVSQVKEKNIVVKIADNTKVEMLRSGIQRVILDESKGSSKS